MERKRILAQNKHDSTKKPRQSKKPDAVINLSRVCENLSYAKILYFFFNTV